MAGPDFIEQTLLRAMDYNGKEMSPQDMATEFAKCDIDTRVNHLQHMRENDGELTVAEAARRVSYEKALRNTHEKLRKIGR